MAASLPLRAAAPEEPTPFPCHAGESGHPVSWSTALNSRLRGNDKGPHPALRATPGSSPGGILPEGEGRALRAGGGGQRRVGAVERGEHALEVRNLRQVVIDDVGIARILCQKVLVIVLGAIKRLARFDRGDDRRAEHMP